MHKIAIDKSSYDIQSFYDDLSTGVTTVSFKCDDVDVLNYVKENHESFNVLMDNATKTYSGYDKFLEGSIDNERGVITIKLARTHESQIKELINIVTGQRMIINQLTSDTKTNGEDIETNTEAIGEVYDKVMAAASSDDLNTANEAIGELYDMIMSNDTSTDEEETAE